MFSKIVRWRVFFTGRVQHVGFRYTAYYFARDFQLTGWVFNMKDGRVEIEVQGTIINIRRFILKLKSQPNIHIEHMDIETVSSIPFEHQFKVIGYD